jgi:hypothetical protein
MYSLARRLAGTHVKLIHVLGFLVAISLIFTATYPKVVGTAALGGGGEKYHHHPPQPHVRYGENSGESNDDHAGKNGGEHAGDNAVTSPASGAVPRLQEQTGQAATIQTSSSQEPARMSPHAPHHLEEGFRNDISTAGSESWLFFPGGDVQVEQFGNVDYAAGEHPLR